MPMSEEKPRGLNNSKTRRGQKNKFKVKNSVRLVGVNANGILSKLQSLNYIICELNPTIICLQETKVRKAGKN